MFPACFSKTLTVSWEQVLEGIQFCTCKLRELELYSWNVKTLSELQRESDDRKE